VSIVVITGASRGIGRYLCDQLSADYQVVGIARSVPEAFEHPSIQVDVTDQERLRQGIKELDLRRVYGLINCAGIASMNLFLTTPAATIRKVLEVNTLGTMNACTAILPSMIRNKTGRIINFSSLGVKIGLEGEAVYVASKAAVEAYSRVLAKEVGGYDITVNVVSPNPMETDLLAGVAEEKIQKVINEHQAIKRMGEMEDVLNVIRFYLDERSSMISGQNLVLGGY
jgi:3-oxoacyl-[acyl-carrier protein] reductase